MSKKLEGFEDFWTNGFRFDGPPWNTHYDCAKRSWLKCAELKDKEIEALKAENLYIDKKLRATETALIKVADYVSIQCVPSDNCETIAKEIIRYLKNDR